MSNLEKEKNEKKLMSSTIENNLQKDNMDKRINKLYGLSDEIPQKELKEYDPKEIAKVRKKLLILLGVVISLGMFAIFIIISPVFSNKGDKLSPNNNENNDNENNADNEEKDPEKPNNYIGDLEINDDLIVKLNNKITFTIEDFKNIDLFPLYSKELLNITDVSNDIKLYLLKTDNRFLELLDNAKIGEYINTCDANGVSISKTDFDKLVHKVFGPNMTIDYNDINYNYFGGSNYVKITLSYNSDSYIVKCNNYLTNDSISKYIQQQLIKAIGHEGSIELYQKVVFISEKGVFKDPNMQILITNNRNATFQEYIEKGNLYKYTFVKHEDDYYLSKIEIVKEDN